MRHDLDRACNELNATLRRMMPSVRYCGDHFKFPSLAIAEQELRTFGLQFLEEYDIDTLDAESVGKILGEGLTNGERDVFAFLHSLVDIDDVTALYEAWADFQTHPAHARVTREQFLSEFRARLSADARRELVWRIRLRHLGLCGRLERAT
jgi:hypothetical protein